MPFEYVGNDRFKHREQAHKAAGERGFIAVDGEGVTDASGSHHYTMLATSTDAYLSSGGSGRHLLYNECFEFLVRLGSVRSGRVIVAFSFNYDCEMMLKGLSVSHAAELWQTNRTTINDGVVKWHLERVPSKYFRITKVEGDKRQSVTIWDVFGFFQMSFVDALKEWDIADETTRERIKAMKDKRSQFSNADSEAMLKYSQEECTLLVQLVEKLYQSFVAADIRLNRFDGAGAAASALMRTYGVGAHIGQSTSMALNAYYGGRFEVFRVGTLNTVYNADINSAYPFSAVTLPTGWGDYTLHDNFRPGDFGLYYCHWNLSSSEQLMPFPHRANDGSIMYPSAGSGWYHGVEVEAAMRCYPKEIHIDSSIIYTPKSSEQPFAFLSDVYKTRQQYKQSGDVRHRPLKLAMNSVYGKLAQGQGFRGKRPLFQNYYLAGLITAATRAQLLEASFPIRHNLVQLATDGIFSLEQPEVSYGTALGQWEHGQYDEFFSVQSGVYRGIRDGQSKARNRGFSTREINFAALQDAFERTGLGASIRFEPTRFITFASTAPHYRDYANWRKVPRHLTVGCGRKYPSSIDNFCGVQQLLPGLPRVAESAAYRPKRGWLDAEAPADLLQFAAENC